MKILFTGKGTSGSWQIRGVQIGHALGARVVPMASLEDCKWADVIVAVKRIPEGLLDNIRRSERPWAWDCVDAYPQPESTHWDKARSMVWLRSELARISPTLAIWANRRMAEDARCGEVIYHHHRPGIEVNPIREQMEVVGYEGSERYIAAWRPHLERECKKRGARFVVNPARLADLDVVVALRGQSGYPQASWKSNVKLANAHGSGTPFIGAMECGYGETASYAEYWADLPAELSAALDLLMEAGKRREIQKEFLKRAYTIEQAAQRYREVLCALKS